MYSTQITRCRKLIDTDFKIRGFCYLRVICVLYDTNSFYSGTGYSRLGCV